MQFSPSCLCCPDCEIIDKSTGFDTDPFTVQSGTWNIDGGPSELLNTASGISMSATHSDPVWIRFEVRPNTVGQVVSVLLYSNSTGSSFQVEVRLTFGDATTCGKFAIYDGAGSLISTSVALDLWPRADIGSTYEVTICVSEVRILASVAYSTTNEVSLSADLSLTSPSYYSGFSTDVQGGTLAFETYLLGRAECYDCNPCDTTEDDVFYRIARWDMQPLGETYASRCHETISKHTSAGNDYVHDVLLKNAVLSAWDREYGYRAFVTCTQPVLTAAPLELCRIYLDGGSHHAIFYYDAGFVIIKLYRGAVLLKTSGNLVYPDVSGAPRDFVYEASLQDTRFCAGYARTPAFGPPTIVRQIQGETTATHNGDSVQVTQDDQTYAVGIKRVDVIRCPHCPGCTSCDETPTTEPIYQNHTDEFQVVLGTIVEGYDTFPGGTYVLQYAGGCVWEYRTASQTLQLWNNGSYFRLYWTVGTRTLIFDTDTLTQPIECDSISGETLTRVDDSSDTGTMTAL